MLLKNQSTINIRVTVCIYLFIYLFVGKAYSSYSSPPIWKTQIKHVELLTDSAQNDVFHVSLIRILRVLFIL